MLEGTVIRSTGSWYRVRTPEGIYYDCRIKGRFRIDDQVLTNPVAVGDLVQFNIENEVEQTGLIQHIGARKNYIVRQSPRNRFHLHLLASNIDRALLIVTIVEPMLKQGFIDRFLLMTEPHDLPVKIVFNKCDLYNEEDLEVFLYMKEIYQKIGYEVDLVSARTGYGVSELKAYLTNHTTLISGQSGVGKSSLLNTISPELGLRTGDLSGYTGKGQHTTTFAEMFELPFGGYIIDTPGIKTLTFNNLDVQDVAHNFREIFQEAQHCKFANCTHRNEPKCAVKACVENGDISELRYANYLIILEEIEEHNHWERPDRY